MARSHKKIAAEPNWLTGDLGTYPDAEYAALTTTLASVGGVQISKVAGSMQQSDLLRPLLMDIARKGLAHAYNKYELGVAAIESVDGDTIEQTKYPKHVVIVGAGMAGLVAAHELVRVGHKVTILETQNRVGGRVKTISHDGGGGLKRTHKQGGNFAPGLYVDGKYTIVM